MGREEAGLLQYKSANAHSTKVCERGPLEAWINEALVHAHRSAKELKVCAVDASH